MHLQEDKIVFAGDLVLANTHPMVGDGNIDEWMSILGRMQSFDIDMIVPGHGGVEDRRMIGQMLNYFAYIRDLVSDELEHSTSLEELVNAPRPAFCEDWRFGHVFRWNLQSLASKNRNVVQQ